jgi:hypothetical protein
VREQRAVSNVRDFMAALRFIHVVGRYKDGEAFGGGA